MARRFEGVFDPLPFMLGFPQAQSECAFFELALEWIESVCFGASEPQAVRAACEADPEWRMSCMSYPGTEHGPDLAALLAMASPPSGLTHEQLRRAIVESIAHLAQRHPGLRGTAFEPLHDETMEAGRLHLADDRRIRVVLHRYGGLGNATTLALQAADRLREHGRRDDLILLVLPQLGSAQLLRTTPRVAAVGLEFSVMARALLELARVDSR